MSKFHVGQAVVCVYAGNHVPGKTHDKPLKEGMIYIIREVDVPNHLSPLVTGPCVRLSGITRRNDMGYLEARFEPIAEVHDECEESEDVECQSSQS